jgi:predicted transcriptional regulator
MSLTIELPAETERELSALAKESGRTPEAVAVELLERHLALRTMDEILAPFRKQVAESGMSEEELDAFFQDVRQEVWEEQQGGAK